MVVATVETVAAVRPEIMIPPFKVWMVIPTGRKAGNNQMDAAISWTLVVDPASTVIGGAGLWTP